MEVANFPTLTANVNTDTTHNLAAKTELSNIPATTKLVLDTKLVLPEKPITMHTPNTSQHTPILPRMSKPKWYLPTSKHK